MSRRYEVSNRYSSYLEARRHYLDKESDESDVDIEVKTILRQPFNRSYRTVSTSDSNSEKEELNSTPKEMVLVPEIVVEKKSTEEIEIPSLESLKPEKEMENGPPSSTSNIEEKIKEKAENISKITQEKFSEVAAKLTDLVAKTKNKMEDIYKDVSKDIGSLWSVICLSIITICCLFTLISLYRAVSRPMSETQGWFCTYFAIPFAPLFNALCEDENMNFIHRLPMEMWLLADEIGLSISHGFHNIANGFEVFGTIFNAISDRITDNLSFGCHELGENVGENVSHLLHFFVQLVHLIFHFFFSAIATIAGGIAGAASVIHDYFDPPQSFFW